MTKKKEAVVKVSGAHDQIEKEFGNVLISGDVLKEYQGKIIPISLSLDLALNGGLPEGTVMTVSGVSGCGKTTLCLTIIANAQAMGKKCYYIDIESRLRTELLDCIPGLQVDKLTIIKSSEDKFLTAEDYLNIIDYIVSEEKGCLIIIDSVASLMPESKAAVKFGESSRMTATPTLLYEFFRKCIAKINVFNSNIIGISHMQANVGGYGGPVEVGGNALKFYASIKMMCLSSPEIPADDPNKTGRISKFKIPKSAITKPTEGSFYIEYGKGYDYIQDLVENAIQLSLIEKTGAWYTIQSGKYKDTKIQGMEKVMNIVREDTNLAKELDATIRSMILGTK